MSIALSTESCGVIRMSLPDALELGPAAWSSLESRRASPSPFMSWAWHRAWLEAVPAEEVPAEEVAATAAAAVAPDTPAESPSARQPSPTYSAAPQPDSGESTLNVLSTVGPVLLKRYGPALAVVGLLIFVVIKIIRRKS